MARRPSRTAHSSALGRVFTLSTHASSTPSDRSSASVTWIGSPRSHPGSASNTSGTVGFSRSASACSSASPSSASTGVDGLRATSSRTPRSSCLASSASRSAGVPGSRASSSGGQLL
ncbi:MAG: hypothetical protein MUF64_00995 [Polyangiaceae bacterium]|nr:hypothetical protein [Polyangiaceae bacterium]